MEPNELGVALPSVQKLPLTRKPSAELSLSAQKHVQEMLEFSFERTETSCQVSMEVGNVDHVNDLSWQFRGGLSSSTRALNREIMKKGAEVNPCMTASLGDGHWEGLMWDEGKTDDVGTSDAFRDGSSTTVDRSWSKPESASKHEETSLDRHDDLSIRVKEFEVLQEVGTQDVLHLFMSCDISMVGIDSSTIVKTCPMFATPARIRFTKTSP